MSQIAQTRFPTLPPQEHILHKREGLALSVSLLPLPLGEVAVLLSAWLLVLQA